jgi:hypothetical protein
MSRLSTAASLTSFSVSARTPGCSQRLRVTLDEYRHVREDSTRFIVVKGHVANEIERVVQSAEDQAIIEKHGHAGRVAIELDNADTLDGRPEI